VERSAALITGASAGIGATFARVLGAVGLDLILVARRRDRLEALAAEIRGAHGVEVEPLVADLSRDEEIRTVADRVAATNRLDVLVNNAGFGTLGRFYELDLESQDKMHRLHVMATVWLTHAALRGMVKRGRGAIINVASSAGFAPSPGNASYNATKAWMISFTESLWMELKSARSPVRVQALCPGFTYTEFQDVMGADRGRIPGFMWLRPEDVVAESMRGLSLDEPVVVTGRGYRWLTALLRFVPRHLYYAASTLYARGVGRDLPPPQKAERQHSGQEPLPRTG
jgi:short-subunit dehydrogenase